MNAAVLALLLGVGNAGGCAQVSREKLGATSSQAELQIRVVHVWADSGPRAGTPLTDDSVLSVLDWNDTSMPAVVVDGQPMHWTACPGESKRLHRDSLKDYPQVCYFGGLRCLGQGNRIAGLTVLPPETIIKMGGYFLRQGDDSQATFLRLSPQFVTAKIIEAPSATPFKNRGNLIWIKAPQADYRGFVGGPVAIESPRGDFSVVAVLLFQFANTGFGSDTDAILAACLTPKELCEVGH